MNEMITERLLIRRWRESDLVPWAAMNADPEVREHLGGILTREQSDSSVARFEAELERRGHGWLAVETREGGEFIGFAGLDEVEEQDPVSGVEIGWRLARSAWGHGYATEAARAVLAHGFDALALPEILAITTAANLRSQKVMHRLGMTHDPAEDFADPDAPQDPARRNVVFRLRREDHGA
ncbi:GNAT family N-acetyltransferase [Kitasatospora sp. SUK 42]|uniref:GNAT family N-acetyltransferase n=1 Tax=Kitasatospora sp. SUK 42 TaxID=1588882 RepID=UPI0018CBB359|nr:GNAT family N-acetyltransferase [Kitasatospora sp. SUK 42]MBV2156504.1 GNAT family N-acetyltransferase [Kitasatospora sp. SUK 42]